jgi:tetratricopeptide (TPR) repeat protein
MKAKVRLLFLAFFASVALAAQAQTAEEGIAHLEAERVSEAQKVLTSLAESNPTPENLFALGHFYVRTGQFDKAMAAHEKGAALDPKNPLNQVGVGVVELGKGNTAKAKEIFAEVEKRTKGRDAQILFRIGQAYTLFDKYKDPAEAIRLIDLATKRDRTIADAFIVKGDALLARNEGGPAVTAYEYALMAKPGYALANNRIGQVYLQGKNYNLALDFYRKAIESSPDFSPAYKDLAELYFFARQYKRAAENFDLYLEKSGNQDPEMVLRAAQFAFTADDFEQSLKLLDSVKGKLNNPITKRMYGWGYFKTNNMDGAISNLEEFIKVAPEKIVADDYKYLGNAYNRMASGKSYDEKGMQYLMKAADLDTNLAAAAVTYKEIGGLYYKEKEYSRAATSYTKGINLDTVKATPTDFYNLGMSYFQNSNTVGTPAGADSLAMLQKKNGLLMQADSVFQIITTKIPDWPIAYYWRGSCLYNAYDRQENIDKGISAPHYTKFVELSEKDANTPKGMLRIALGYLAFYQQSTVKDLEAAKKYWEKLLVVDPNNQAAKEALGK